MRRQGICLEAALEEPVHTSYLGCRFTKSGQSKWLLEMPPLTVSMQTWANPGKDAATACSTSQTLLRSQLGSISLQRNINDWGEEK